MRTALEVHDDPQVAANSYLVPAQAAGRGSVQVVPSPVRVNGVVPDSFMPAPEHGADTEAVLLELGRTWDQIDALRENATI